MGVGWGEESKQNKTEASQVVGGWGGDSDCKCIENCHSMKPRHRSAGHDTSWQQPRSQEGLVPEARQVREMGQRNRDVWEDWPTSSACETWISLPHDWKTKQTPTRKSIPSAAHYSQKSAQHSGLTQSEHWRSQPTPSLPCQDAAWYSGKRTGTMESALVWWKGHWYGGKGIGIGLWHEVTEGFTVEQLTSFPMSSFFLLETSNETVMRQHIWEQTAKKI